MDDTTPADEQSEPIENNRPRKRKPHSIPPIPVAPNWREEIAALKDVGGELAVALWRALRNVRMWLDTAPERREGLFRSPRLRTQEQVAYACIRAPQLIEPFGTFAFLLRAPASIEAARIAEACQQVYTWADAHSLVATSVHFAEAAATVAPDNPAYANDAGWSCFKAAYYERAETWYTRGYGLAVRMRHHDLTTSRNQSIRALLRLGILMQTMGRHDQAKEYYDLASRRAARTGRRPLAAKASHDLLTYMAEVGTYPEGEAFASTALDLYALDAPQLPALVHDYAVLLVKFHYYTYAVPVLQLAVPHIQRPEIQAIVWSTLARAAAGARRRDLFDLAEQKAVPLLALYDEYAPAAFVHLGEGKRAFGEWDNAERYAALGLEASKHRQQALWEQKALTLLDQIASRQPGPVDEPPPNPDQIRLLTRRFAARLRRWKAPGKE
ncbi:MAG TPA: hypothetical protein VHG28_00595 [Longimicrobiaceae bacterium]|nr:hypothetical protein [Longimicrobiaceae bacterium]